MEALPVRVGRLAAEASWPDPDDDGNTQMTAAQVRVFRALFSALIDYVEIQLKRCKRDE